MTAAYRVLATFLCVGVGAACSDNNATGSDGFQGCATVAAYTIGQARNGTLATTDCRLAVDNTYIDYYEFTLQGAATVTISMQSTEFDAYLILWNRAGGSPVAEDDDGGGGTDAQIVQNLSAGTYVIGANSFSAGETGAYTLSSN